MKGIRIEPDLRSPDVFVDVVCDCGANGLTDQDTGTASFKHRVEIAAGRSKMLVCMQCQKKYRVDAQGTHVYVTDADD